MHHKAKQPSGLSGVAKALNERERCMLCKSLYVDSFILRFRVRLTPRSTDRTSIMTASVGARFPIERYRLQDGCITEPIPTEHGARFIIIHFTTIAIVY